jgi:hypothetical protein
MNAPDKTALSEKDKILIMLEEYKSLRSDILLKTTLINQIYAVAGTVFVTTVGLTVANGPKGWYAVATGGSILAIILILVTGASILVNHDIRNLSRRIQQIEADINRRAGGEQLLRWETISSTEAIFFRRRKHHPEKMPAEK